MPPPAKMRLRITRQLCESIDGIQLSSFRPGCVYDFGTLIGSYLLSVGAAAPVPDDTAYSVLPPEKLLFGPVAPDRLPPARPSLSTQLRDSVSTAADSPGTPTRRRRRARVHRRLDAGHLMRRLALVTESLKRAKEYAAACGVKAA